MRYAREPDPGTVAAMGVYADLAAGNVPAITDAARPELAALSGCPQTAEFHGEGDVATHTELVMEQVEGLLGTVGDVTGPAETILRVAAVLHDVGKPATTVEREPGCWSAHGHAEEGARIVSELFASDDDLAGLPLGVAAAVHALVRDHMWTYRPEHVSPGAAIRMAHLVDPRLLVALWRADTRGRVCDDAAMLADQVDYAEALLADHGADRPDPFPHVAAFTDPADLEPRVRREVLRAVVDGRITDPGAAAAFVAARERAGTGAALTYTIGLPGAGKSTWARSRWQPVTDGMVLSAVGARRRDRKAAAAVVRDQIPEVLRSGGSCLVDATHVTRSSRDRMLADAETYGASVHAVFFDVATQLSVDRQSTRPYRDAVPSDAVRAMRRELRFPSPDEYDTLTVVDASGHMWSYGPGTRFTPRSELARTRFLTGAGLPDLSTGPGALTDAGHRP